MRLDTPVYFQSVTEGEYDENTGDYGPDKVTEVKKYASVTNSGAETLNLVYGELKQGSLTVRILNRCIPPFDRLRIDEKIYRVDMDRKIRNFRTFIVSEVQHGRNQG